MSSAHLMTITKIGAGTMVALDTASLEDVFDAIVESDKLAEQTAKVREKRAIYDQHGNGDKKHSTYKELGFAKCNLPTLVPGGAIEGEIKDSHSSIAFSGYMSLDFDDVENPAEVRDALKEVPYIALAFISPSGTGVKAFAAIGTCPDLEYWTAAFRQVSDDLARRGYSLDATCKNYNRLTFLAHDPDAWLKQDAKPIKVRLSKLTAPAPKPKTAPKIKVETAIPTYVSPALKTRFKEPCQRVKNQWDSGGYSQDHTKLHRAIAGEICKLTSDPGEQAALFANSFAFRGPDDFRKSARAFELANAAVEKENSVKVDFSSLWEEEEEEKQKVEQIAVDWIGTLPKGLIKRIAMHSHKAAFLPLQEASLVMALQFFSVLTGRMCQTSLEAGLTSNIVLVGKTGIGKDEVQAGLGRLADALRKENASVAETLLCGEFASGPGIETTFQNRKRVISYVPEFTDFFRNLTDPRAPDHKKDLLRKILDLFNGANAGRRMHGRRLAKMGECAESVERPLLCITGETTHDFYSALNHQSLASGLLQRFLVLDIPSDRRTQANRERSVNVPQKLVRDLLEVAIYAQREDLEQEEVLVVQESPQARQLLRDYDDQRREQTQGDEGETAERELLNRSGLKVWRLATLLAVSEDWRNPCVSAEHFEWARRFVDHCDAHLLALFKSGMTGAGQVRQEAEIKRAAQELRDMTPHFRQRAGMSSGVAGCKKFVTHKALKNRVTRSACFTEDRNGAVAAFDRCVLALVRDGTLRETTLAVREKYGHFKGGALYVF